MAVEESELAGAGSLAGLEIAVTVDELLLWDGSPMPKGYDRAGIVASMVTTFADHGIDGVWAFAHTSPMEDEPSLRGSLEHWVEGGHHLGNHTHAHASLNWVEASTYCSDIDRAEELIGDLIARAPKRYFRYAMDMTSGSEGRRGAVEDHLRRNGYTNAPITAWFGDFGWIAPYHRALTTGDRPAADMLRNSFVAAAMFNLRSHADAARTMFGRNVPLIFLIHGTPIAQDCLGTILAAIVAEGGRFTALPEAMADITNQVLSPVDGRFRNHMQRLARAHGIEVADVGPEQVAAVLNAAPMPGADSIATYEDMLHRMCDRAGGTYDWDWS